MVLQIISWYKFSVRRIDGLTKTPFLSLFPGCSPLSLLFCLLVALSLSLSSLSSLSLSLSLPPPLSPFFAQTPRSLRRTLSPNQLCPRPKNTRKDTSETFGTRRFALLVQISGRFLSGVILIHIWRAHLEDEMNRGIIFACDLA